MFRFFFAPCSLVPCLLACSARAGSRQAGRQAGRLRAWRNSGSCFTLCYCSVLVLALALSCFPLLASVFFLRFFFAFSRLPNISCHVISGMVNVRHPRCADPSCKRQPSFGIPGGDRGRGDGKTEGKGKGKPKDKGVQEHKGKAVFCVMHKEPGMVDVVNVKKKPKAA